MIFYMFPFFLGPLTFDLNGFPSFQFSQNQRLIQIDPTTAGGAKLVCENQAWEPREKTTHKESQSVAFNEDCGHQNMFLHWALRGENLIKKNINRSDLEWTSPTA